MGVNKVMAKGEVVLDLTQDTVTPNVLADGYTAHNAAGDPIVGVGGAVVATIDDTAGKDDTDVVWSADRSYISLNEFHNDLYFNFLHGGIGPAGKFNAGLQNRIRTQVINVTSGTIVSCAEGYKFNIGLYRNANASQIPVASEETKEFSLIRYYGLRTDPLVIDQDCYIQIGIGTTNDDTLWETIDDSVVYNNTAHAAANAISIIGKNDSLSSRINHIEKALTDENEMRLRKVQYKTYLLADLQVANTISDKSCVMTGVVQNTTLSYEGEHIYKYVCPGYYIKAITYRIFTSENEKEDREILFYNDYQLNENYAISPYIKDSGTIATRFVLKKDLTRKTNLITDEDLDYIIENAKLYVNRMIDPTLQNEGDYADAKAVGDILISPTTIEDLGFTFGGINSTGSSNRKSDRIRFISNKTGKGAFWVEEGTEISVANGYKFNVAMFDEYQSNANYNLIGFRHMTTGTCVISQDCFIRISIGTVGDDILWTIDENSIKQYTEEGLAAQSAITIIGSNSVTLKDRVESLEKNENSVITTPWESVNELKDEIPLNALEFHSLFDDFVENGKLTRTLISNIGNDPNYPVYMYTLRNDMDHKASDYSRIRWNGTNELYQRPKIWLDAGIHGNERTMPFVLYSFIEKLCDNIYYQDMCNAFDWYFVPLVNPWGFSHSAYNNTTGTWDNGTGYSNTTFAKYTIYENTPEHHHGIRRNEDGIDANRDFSAFNTQEAQNIRNAVTSLTADGRNFIFAIDSHLSGGGSAAEMNALGSFLSLHYGASQVDKNFIYGKWMQAGSKTESIMSNYCSVNNVQSVFPWDGTNLLTMRNYLHNFADYAMCFEGGQTCAYYSGSLIWQNEISRTFCNTQYHLFLNKLTAHWM